MHLKPKNNIFITVLILAFILLSFGSAFADSVIYTYDDTNRMIRVEYEDGTAINYIYDAVGRTTLFAADSFSLLRIDRQPKASEILIESEAGNIFEQMGDYNI
jgi:hypothetical protein